MSSMLPFRYKDDIKLTILSLLNSLGAVNPSRAISLNELAKLLGLPVDKLQNSVEELSRNGYVNKVDSKIYINNKGIMLFIGIIS